MKRTVEMRAMLKFYKNKLKNGYYDNEEEKIRIEAKIEHFEKILGDKSNG